MKKILTIAIIYLCGTINASHQSSQNDDGRSPRTTASTYSQILEKLLEQRNQRPQPTTTTAPEKEGNGQKQEIRK